MGSSKRWRPRVSRSESRLVACPYCGADCGEQCVGKRGRLRESSHLERVQVAARR